MAGNFFDGAFYNGGFFGALIEPASIDYQGGSGRPGKHRKRRNLTKEMLEAFERTIRATLRGEPEEAPAPIPTLGPIDVSHGLSQALDALLAQSTVTRDLSAQVARLKREVAAYDAEQRRKALLADDEDVMLLL